MDEALVNMVIEDSQPFTIVEDSGFRKLVKVLNPNYVLPTRQVCILKYEACFHFAFISILSTLLSFV